MCYAFSNLVSARPCHLVLWETGVWSTVQEGDSSRTLWPTHFGPIYPLCPGPLSVTWAVPLPAYLGPLQLPPTSTAASHLGWQSLESAALQQAWVCWESCTSMCPKFGINGGGRGGQIQNSPLPPHPKEGHGKNLAEYISFLWRHVPQIPFTDFFGVRTLPTDVRPTQAALFFHWAQRWLCVVFQMCSSCLASIPLIPWDFLAHCKAATPPPNCSQRPFFPCCWFDANGKDLVHFF